MYDPMSALWIKVQADLAALNAYGDPTSGDFSLALQDVSMGWAFHDANRFQGGLERLQSFTVGGASVQAPTVSASVHVLPTLVITVNRGRGGVAGTDQA